MGAPGASATPELSLVIPAYREADRLLATLDRVTRYLSSAYPSFELIVVDDGSPDATASVARKALASHGEGRVLSLGENRGKGAAVRAGAMAARGRRVLFSDADLSTPIEEEKKLAAALDRGADAAIGTRAHPEARITRAQGTTRQSMGRMFNVFVRALGLTRFRDTQCGFKMFSREAARAAFPPARIEGFAFDVEILYLLERAGFRVVEVPVEWHNDPASRLHVIWDSLRMLRELLWIRCLYPPWRGSGTIRAESPSRSSSPTERSRDEPGGPA